MYMYIQVDEFKVYLIYIDECKVYSINIDECKVYSGRRMYKYIHIDKCTSIFR